MSSSKTHIEIIYRASEEAPEITSWYAVTPELKRAWEFWLAAQSTAPSNEAMETWLNKNADNVNPKLDRADGPAVIMNFSDGSRTEEWWVDGKVHRTGAPAVLDFNADGSLSREVWFTNDKIDRADGPAIVVRGHDGTILSEQWYHHGVLDKSREPAPRSPVKPPSSPAP